MQKIKEQIGENEAKINAESNLLADRNNSKAAAIAAENADFNNFKATYFEKKSTLNATINTLN